MSLQTRLASLITAIGADIKALQTSAVALTGAQTITGVKTFADNTLLMRNAAGTITAEPYSDVNPPETLMFTDFPTASVPTPAAGFSQLHTPDGKNLYLKDSDGVTLPVDSSLENLTFGFVGTLTVGTGTLFIPIHGGTFTIISIAARLQTAPTGASVILDVNKNSTTIFGTQGNRPTIAASGNLATVGAFSVTSVTTGDYLSMDVDQIGSTIAGANLVLSVRLMRTA